MRNKILIGVLIVLFIIYIILGKVSLDLNSKPELTDAEREEQEVIDYNEDLFFDEDYDTSDEDDYGTSDEGGYDDSESLETEDNSSFTNPPILNTDEIANIDDTGEVSYEKSGVDSENFTDIICHIVCGLDYKFITEDFKNEFSNNVYPYSDLYEVTDFDDIQGDWDNKTVTLIVEGKTYKFSFELDAKSYISSITFLG